MRAQTKKWGIVAFAISLIAAMLWFSMRPVPMGPTKIFVNAQSQVRVLAAGAIYTLDAQGKLLARDALPASLQMAGASDFLVLSDGQVLLADANQHDVLRCDARVQHCTSLYAQQGRGAGALGKALKLAVDEKAGLLWVADTANHRLLKLGLDGQHRQTFGGDRFIYPNQIGFSRAGDLVVADTNHHLLRGFDPEGDLNTERWLISMPNHQDARPGRTWPTAWAEVADHWWVITKDGAMKNGDVLRFNHEGAPRTRVLPKALDPFSIAVIGSDVLVADAENVAIWRASFEGQSGSRFGDAAFLRALRDVEQQRQQQHTFLKMLPMGIAAVALLAAVCLYRLGEQVSAPQAPSAPWPQQSRPPAPGAGEALWIDAHPEQRARFRRQRWLIWAVALLTLVSVACVEFLLSQRVSGLTLQSQQLPLLQLIAGVLLALEFHYQQRSQGLRIGVDAEAVLVQDHEGRISRHPFAGVQCSKLMLLAGQHLLPLHTRRQGAVYPPERLHEVLLSRLPAQNQLSTFRLSVQLLRQAHPTVVCAGLWGLTMVWIYIR